MAKKKIEKQKNFCRQCAHARDFQNISFKTGKPILCKCDFQEYSMLLNYDWCENFKLNKNDK